MYIVQLSKLISVIPLGLMGEAHFSLRVPKYLNVGSLGLTLAHEMLHSLDSTGRGFDSRGVLANDFWDYETRKTFANVSQCINNQYREHFKRPIRVDSRTMMLEVSAKKSFKKSSFAFFVRFWSLLHAYLCQYFESMKSLAKICKISSNKLT